MKFPEYLKDLRKRLGVTQQVLADLTGYSQNYIAQLESGSKKNPRSSFLKTLASLDRQSIVQGNKPISLGDSSVAVEESAQATYQVAPPELTERLRAKFDALVSAAGDSRERLGWLAVELDKLQLTAAAWMSNAEVNRQVIEAKRLLDADNARARRESA